MTDWEKIISFESLYKAHRRARLSKRHKKEVIEFENDLSQNLWKLHYDLKYGNYKISDYHSFMIYDPKEREIQAISYRDRVVQHSLCDNYLTPLLERKLIFDNVACRKNKGSSLAYKRLRHFMISHYKTNGENGYFVKIDIKKYFNSIDHSILKEKLREILTDKNIEHLLYFIIDSYSFSFNRGLPMGNQSSQCFALLYLDCIDKYIKYKLKIKYYVRYMDDFILIVSSKKYAQHCLNCLADKILKLNIITNNKSQIISIKNGIDFLGYHFTYGKNGKIVQTLMSGTKKRILFKVKRMNYLFVVGKKTKKKLFCSKVSYDGYFARCENFYFNRKICKILT